MYGHITFIDNGATVLRADGSETQAAINLPLAPGDVVVTAIGGRCELQFDNGTVVRLDKESRLRLTTVLAPSLTSNWEITTLDLEKGQLYALPQAYNREMFQVVTPNAAVRLKSRTAAYIRIDAGGGSSFFSAGGTFEVLFGADVRSLKKAKVRAGRPLAVSGAHVLAEQVEKKDIEFTAWNEYVDRHFKELHYGIAMVPANLTKFKNKALLYWAEKWSSRYGEWIYDNLFGYVWRPADERFAFAQRPFFHADFVRIHDNLFLVPQQPWGWLPAHMGTWVWLKRGWTWIPGDWFHNGIVDFQGSYFFPTLGYYWNMFNWHPRPAGEPGWPNRTPRKPQLPGPALDLVRKIAKVSPSNESKRLAVGRVVPAIDNGQLPPAPANAPPSGGMLPAPTPDVVRASGPKSLLKAERASRPAGETALARDWNPDSRWAMRNACTIRYSSSRNAVICPERKVSSEGLRGIDRMNFRNATSSWKQGTEPGGTAASQPANSSSGASAADGTIAADPAGSGDSARTDDGRR